MPTVTLENYSSMKLELLGLKWAVTEKFRDYLLGQKFTVLTDNNPLKYLETARLKATAMRWATDLAQFDFKIIYRSGVTNKAADALSRRPEGDHHIDEAQVLIQENEYAIDSDSRVEYVHIEEEKVNEIFEEATQSTSIPLELFLEAEMDIHQQNDIQLEQPNTEEYEEVEFASRAAPTFPTYSVEELAALQREDKDIKRAIELYINYFIHSHFNIKWNRGLYNHFS